MADVLPRLAEVALARPAAKVQKKASPENAAEAALAGGVPVFGVGTLAEAVEHLRGERSVAAVTVDVEALLGKLGSGLNIFLGRDKSALVMNDARRALAAEAER